MVETGEADDAIGLPHGEGEDRRDHRHGAASGDRREATLHPHPMQRGDAQRQKQRHGAELGGGCQADRDAGEHEVDQPSFGRDAHEGEQGEQDDTGKDDIDRHEARVLQVQRTGR